jgi:hypothetical protein
MFGAKTAVSWKRVKHPNPMKYTGLLPYLAGKAINIDAVVCTDKMHVPLAERTNQEGQQAHSEDEEGEPERCDFLRDVEFRFDLRVGEGDYGRKTSAWGTEKGGR